MKAKKVTDSEKTERLIVQEKNISDNVLNKISKLNQNGALHLPKNYSAANALKSAWLKIQGEKALLDCSKESIANSLLDMVVQGLSPMKNQCYFIPYGKQLKLSRSYLGTIAVTKRQGGIKDIFANIIYDGDTFQYEINTDTGLKVITKHEQDFKSIDNNKILGGYATIVRDGEPTYVEIMTMDQIRKGWEQGATKGKSPAHTKFPEEMAKKTVINRACKIFLNTSDDSDVVIESINRTTANEYSETAYEVVVDEEIEKKANKELIDVNEENNGSEPSEEEKQIILSEENEASASFRNEKETTKAVPGF